MNSMLILIFSLIPVAFYTLMERRILGNFHLRLGPMMVGFLGIFQPFSDAMKLFLKSDEKIRFLNLGFWFISPSLAILIYILSLTFSPLGKSFSMTQNFFIMMICLLSMNVYFLIFSSIFSGSKYSSLGGYRSVTQMISYEIILIFLFISIFIILGEWKLDMKQEVTKNLNFLFLIPFLIIWMMVMLAESNRLPFDFMEGESELVSGFNTEYWGGFFSFFFIYEYGMMIIFSIISSFFLFHGMFSILFFCFLLYLFLWVRSTTPRYRFDFLMEMTWKKLLVLTMSIFIFLLYSIFFFAKEM